MTRYALFQLDQLIDRTLTCMVATPTFHYQFYWHVLCIFYQWHFCSIRNMSLNQTKLRSLVFTVAFISCSACWCVGWVQSANGRKRLSPVSEVQNSLNGISTSCTDVSFKSRKQRHHHIHPVLLLFSEKTQHLHCTLYSADKRWGLMYISIWFCYFFELNILFQMSTPSLPAQWYLHLFLHVLS